jgi:3-oxoadipate enol-lactonase
MFEHAGCRLSYWLDGPVDAPLVVFTPGAFADHTMFDDQVADVTRRYRMLRWDVRGHGLSRPTTAPFTAWQAAEDLAALLDHLEAPRVALVGQSIGGNISQDFIFRFPERCAAAVFLGCTCSTFPVSTFGRAMLALTPGLIRLYPLAAFKRQAMHGSAVTDRAREKLLAMIAPLTAADVGQIAAGIATAVHPEPGYRIGCPTLIAHGDQDALGNIRKVAGPWARRDSSVGPVVIKGAGHVANMDQPEAFNRMVMAFLEENYAAGAR